MIKIHPHFSIPLIMKDYKKEIIKRLKKKRNSELSHLLPLWIEESENAWTCTECARCCRELGPLIKANEIKTLCELTNQKRNIVLETLIEQDKDHDWIFREHPCPFNDENKHCTVYDWRFDSCRKYPETRRFLNSPGNTLIKDSRYCPQIEFLFNKLKAYFNI